MYGNDVYMNEEYNVAAKIEADPYYIVTAHDEPELCRQLSEAMTAIYSANPNFAYAKYFPSEYINTIDFTPKEQEFLRQSGPIRVAVVKQMYPLYYEDEGTAKGIVPACLALITGRTGLEFEYVYAGSYGELRGLLESGEADMIGSYMETERAADADGLACTAPLVSLDSTLVRNKYADLSQEGFVIAVPSGKRPSSTGLNGTIRVYPQYEDCLRAVNRGDADCTYIPASSLEWLYAQDYYANITISVDMVQKKQISFAILRPVNVLLYSVLSKAIGNLTDAEINSVLSQNLLPTPAAPATLKSLFYTNTFQCV